MHLCLWWVQHFVSNNNFPKLSRLLLLCVMILPCLFHFLCLLCYLLYLVWCFFFVQIIILFRLLCYYFIIFLVLFSIKFYFAYICFYQLYHQHPYLLAYLQTAFTLVWYTLNFLKKLTHNLKKLCKHKHIF